eukprot:TRINITY_DN3458_c0_g1_i3.p1 TRINITY_DN3458_c0_g1~~TRINITY_DN3458_c0_g1_i3.p1  ORF type:complete len:328 (+),score=46.99 TRINITY_DN3458_c0_g1_i3:129-1112(+)
MKTRRCLLLSLSLLILFTISSFILWNLLVFDQSKEEIGLNFLDKKVHKYITDFKEDYYRFFMDEEWVSVLKDGEIIDTVLIGHHGLAHKTVMILEGGFVAMVKPVERNLIYLPRSVYSIWDWEEDNVRGATRMDRAYQGWGEIAGYYLDRALQMYRKPPIVGRWLDSKLLYRYDYSVTGRFLYYLPSHQVPVSMHAWVDGLQTNAPRNDIGKYLRVEKTDPGKVTLEKMLGYSDVLVFDFLVDDHDRMGNHNWKSSKDNLLLVWDSGLAWNYGPLYYDLNILCGTHQWYYNLINLLGCFFHIVGINLSILYIKYLGMVEKLLQNHGK